MQSSVIEKTTLEVLWRHGHDHADGLSAREIVDKVEVPATTMA